jgi:hypothetical protein
MTTVISYYKSKGFKILQAVSCRYSADMLPKSPDCQLEPTFIRSDPRKFNTLTIRNSIRNNKFMLRTYMCSLMTCSCSPSIPHIRHVQSSLTVTINCRKIIKKGIFQLHGSTNTILMLSNTYETVLLWLIIEDLFTIL